MTDTARLLASRYRGTLFIKLAALLVVLVAYVWISIATERNTLRLEVHEQGIQVALSLEDAIDVVRSHVFVARKTVEHALIRSRGPDAISQSLIQSESAALLADPKATLDSDDNRSALSSATKMLPTVAAAHQWNPIFQWTYFYDAQARWFLIYPHLSQEELLRASKTGDLSAALKIFFDADGTLPLELIGTRNNPGRDMRWTRPYQDAGGKGRMVTLLSPVYLADHFVGAIGTDVTLKRINQVVSNHAPIVGRTLVVDEQGAVLADSVKSSGETERRVAFSDIFPGQATLPVESNAAWLRYPLRGTGWTLLIHVPNGELNRVAIAGLTPSFMMAGILFSGLLLLVWLQYRRNAAFSDVSATLEETRSALTRADRLGALGGMIASVGREIDTPLSKAAQGMDALQQRLTTFRELQQRGLRRAELDDFVAHVDRESEQAARQLEDANELLQHFRQLAVDQASEGRKQVNLRSVSENVLAVLRPALKRRDAAIENAIPADLALQTDAGTLGQILHYLLIDALERNAHGHSLKLTAGWDTSRSGEQFELVLTDEAATAPDRASEMLALATRLAQESLGGRLEIQPGPEGNRVILRVPVSP